MEVPLGKNTVMDGDMLKGQKTSEFLVSGDDCICKC